MKRCAFGILGATGAVLAGCGAGLVKAAPATPAQLAAAIDPAFRPAAKPPDGDPGWSRMADAVKGAAFSKDDQALAGNAMDATVSDDVISRGASRVKQFDPPIDALEAALQAPVWRAPAHGDAFKTSLLDAQRAVVKAMCYRGRVRLKQHRPGGADDLLDAWAVGDRMAKSGGCLAELQAGLAEKAMANRAIQQAALDGECDPADLARLASGLQAPGTPDGAPLAEAFRNEFAEVFAPAVSRVSFGEPAERSSDGGLGIASVQPAVEAILAGHPHPFDRVQTMRDAGPVWKSLLTNASLPWPRREPTDRVVADLVRGWPASALQGSDSLSDADRQIAQDQLRKTTNPFGKFLIGSVAPAWEGVLQAWFKTEADDDASRIVVALARYRASKAQNPPSLEALRTAGLLDRLPNDPFGDAPFKYDPARGRFWSVGPNGTDDGGKDKPGFATGAHDLVYLAPGKGGYG